MARAPAPASRAPAGPRIPIRSLRRCIRSGNQQGGGSLQARNRPGTHDPWSVSPVSENPETHPWNPSPVELKTRQTPGDPTSWGCHQGTISDPDEVPMGLETAVLHRNDHVWCSGGSGQALGHNPCLYIFFILRPPAAGRG
eukprot:gene23314-biopygen22305